MFPLRIQKFGSRERNWDEEEYSEKERLIMNSTLSNYLSRDHVGVGNEERSKFHKLGYYYGGIVGVAFFMMPWVRQRTLVTRLGIGSLNGYLAYGLFAEHGESVWKERIYRGWIQMIVENDLGTSV